MDDIYMSETEEKGWYYASARFSEEPFRPYVVAIGQSALAWNSLQEALGGVFWVLMGGRGLGVWQSLTADRPKRDMLEAALLNMPETFHEAYPKAKADLTWLTTNTMKLEDARNNVMHAPLQLTAPLKAFQVRDPKTGGPSKRKIPAGATVVPHDWQQNKRALRLTGKDILAEFRVCHARAIALRDYANFLVHAFRMPNASWPDRPRLPVRPVASKN